MDTPKRQRNTGRAHGLVRGDRAGHHPQPPTPATTQAPTPSACPRTSCPPYPLVGSGPRTHARQGVVPTRRLRQTDSPSLPERQRSRHVLVRRAHTQTKGQAMTLPTPCLDCGRVTRVGSRCPTHQRAYSRRHRTTYTYAERQRMRAFVEAWIAQNGHVCVGYERPAHPATDLVADHVIGIAKGGEGGPLRALCSACNRRRSGRQRR
jgi:5-methylcytosine-specific restriction enzyme A